MGTGTMGSHVPRIGVDSAHRPGSVVPARGRRWCLLSHRSGPEGTGPVRIGAVGVGLGVSPPYRRPRRSPPAGSLELRPPGSLAGHDVRRGLEALVRFRVGDVGPGAAVDGRPEPLVCGPVPEDVEVEPNRRGLVEPARIEGDRRLAEVRSSQPASPETMWLIRIPRWTIEPAIPWKSAGAGARVAFARSSRSRRGRGTTSDQDRPSRQEAGADGPAAVDPGTSSRSVHRAPRGRRSAAGTPPERPLDRWERSALAGLDASRRADVRACRPPPPAGGDGAGAVPGGVAGAGFALPVAARSSRSGRTHVRRRGRPSTARERRLAPTEWLGRSRPRPLVGSQQRRPRGRSRRSVPSREHPRDLAVRGAIDRRQPPATQRRASASSRRPTETRRSAMSSGQSRRARISSVGQRSVEDAFVVRSWVQARPAARSPARRSPSGGSPGTSRSCRGRGTRPASARRARASARAAVEPGPRLRDPDHVRARIDLAERRPRTRPARPAPGRAPSTSGPAS